MQLQYTSSYELKAATSGAAGYDLRLQGCHTMHDFSVETETDDDLDVFYPFREGTEYTLRTDVCVQIPTGFVGLLCLRSGMSSTFEMLNGVGIIDSDYRGELQLKVRARRTLRVQHGTRIAQLVIIPCLMGEAQRIVQLDSTVRGTGGFGSTGHE